MKKLPASTRSEVPSPAHYYLKVLIDTYHFTPQTISKVARVPLSNVYRLVKNPSYEATFQTFTRLLALYATMIVPLSNCKTNLSDRGAI